MRKSLGVFALPHEGLCEAAGRGFPLKFL